MNNKYPIYIISKGRWESRLTARTLEEIGQPYHIVIEPQEYEEYAKVIDPKKILVLPFSNLGQGSIPARNWVWEHSISIGAEKHWILDDNIRYFYALKDGKRSKILSNICFTSIEEFVDRYENIALAGMQYTTFCMDKTKYPPFRTNTRIYSCILIQNNIPYRWRGRYNEDTDLSLRALKDGWCTALFFTFLCGKSATMKLKGGNTESLYKLGGQKDGRLLMAQSLRDQHPDVTTIKRRWGRWQHVVDYSKFKANKFILKKGVVIPDSPQKKYELKLVESVKNGLQKT